MRPVGLRFDELSEFEQHRVFDVAHDLANQENIARDEYERLGELLISNQHVAVAEQVSSNYDKEDFLAALAVRSQMITDQYFKTYDRSIGYSYGISQLIGRGIPGVNYLCSDLKVANYEQPGTRLPEYEAEQDAWINKQFSVAERLYKNAFPESRVPKLDEVRGGLESLYKRLRIARLAAPGLAMDQQSGLRFIDYEGTLDLVDDLPRWRNKLQSIAPVITLTEKLAEALDFESYIPWFKDPDDPDELLTTKEYLFKMCEQTGGVGMTFVQLSRVPGHRLLPSGAELKKAIKQTIAMVFDPETNTPWFKDPDDPDELLTNEEYLLKMSKRTGETGRTSQDTRQTIAINSIEGGYMTIVEFLSLSRQVGVAAKQIHSNGVTILPANYLPEDANGSIVGTAYAVSSNSFSVFSSEKEFDHFRTRFMLKPEAGIIE